MCVYSRTKTSSLIIDLGDTYITTHPLPVMIKGKVQAREKLLNCQLL